MHRYRLRTQPQRSQPIKPSFASVPPLEGSMTGHRASTCLAAVGAIPSSSALTTSHQGRGETSAAAEWSRAEGTTREMVRREDSQRRRRFQSIENTAGGMQRTKTVLLHGAPVRSVATATGCEGPKYARVLEGRQEARDYF